MNLKRIWALIRSEVLHGPKDFMLIVAVVLPIMLALVVNLAFGNIFESRARLGVYDQGHSQVVSVLQNDASLSYRSFDSEAALRQAAAAGAIDMGLVLGPGFDSTLGAGDISVKAFTWGEAQAKNRALIPVALATAVREVKGTPVPVIIQATALGDKVNIPWNERLLPMLVLYGVFMTGLMLPASMLLSEKQHRTLEALYVTPATLGDVFMAKGIIVVLLSTIMGVLTLVLAGFFGNAALTVILVLFLGGIMATEFGLMVGAYVKDMNSLYAVLKIGGLVLFAPAFIYMFPQIPVWVGYVFPTYYVVRPVVDLAVGGAGLAQVAVYIGVLGVLVVVGALLVTGTVRRLSASALRLS